MMKIISALKQLKNRWFISLLLLIQFTFGLSTITGSVNVFYNLYTLHNSSVLNPTSTYLFNSNNSTVKLNEEKFNKQQIEEIYQKMKNHKDVISFGTYYEDFIPIHSSTRPLNPQMLAGLTKTIYHSNQPDISAIVIDENYNQLLNIHVEEGKGFSKENFEYTRNGKTDILVGSYFEKYFRVGDVINNQYTIIGFLPRNKYIVNSNSSNTYLKLDKAAIIPMPADIYNDYSAMFTRFHQSTILKLRQGANIDELNQLMQLKGDTIKMHLKNLGQDIDKNIADNTHSEIPQLILGFCFMLFSIIGIVLTTTLSIIMRKREFGIKLVLGESKYGLFRQIILENVFIGIAGMCLSIVHFTWKYSKLLKLSEELNLANALDYKFNIPILFFVFFVLLLIITISNLIIFSYFKKLEPKSLIGGM